MPDIVKVNNEQLLDAIPAYLGFHPTDSVVIVCIRADNKIGPVARLDIAELTNDRFAVADQLGGLVRYASRGVLAFYADEHDVAAEHDLADLLENRGMALQMVLQTNNEPHELTPQMAAEFAFGGRVIANSRDDIRGYVEFQNDGIPPDESILAEMHALDRRDVYLAKAMRADREQAQRDVLACCQRVRDDEPAFACGDWSFVVANLLSVAAVLAYRNGDGAVAQVALDRALRVAPGHRLSHLMVTAMMAGLPPATLDEFVGAVLE